MRRAALAVAVMTLAAGALLNPAAGAGRDGGPATQSACSRTSWIAGTVDLCEGALIYRDYVYDDYGAHDPVQYRLAPATGPLARPYGAQRYPEGAEASADIVDLTVRIVGGELEAVFELNALYQPDQTRAVLLVDSDNNPATGDRFLPGAPASPIRTSGWEQFGMARRGDPERNTLTVRMPLPPGDVWRLQAYTVKVSSPEVVMNVAFRGRETSTLTTGAWFDDRQATALRDGDISDFGHVVHVDELRRKVTRAAEPVKGFHERVYTSEHTLPPGEGMSYTKPHYGRHGNSGAVCEQAFHYFGKYQPYAIYVPDKPAPHGVQLTLHGCSAGMTSVVNGDGMQANVGEARNRIVVSPLGRGPYGYYSDISERDVLDVMHDVLASHEVDHERVFSGGYSMGGYGAYRMAALYPDVFAGAISWVGFTGDAHNNPAGQSPQSEPSGAIGNVIDFVRNLRHVPTAMLYGGQDELVHAPSAVAMQQRFAAEQGGAYEWFFHPVAEHFTFALADDWRKESDWTKDLTRERNPARVTLRVDRSLDYPQYRLVHDGAYWVSKVQPRQAGYADVDATSFACGGTQPVHTEGSRQGSDPLPWQSQNRLRSGTESFPAEPRVEMTVANVASVLVDVDRGLCRVEGPLRYKVTTDGPATVTFHHFGTRTFSAAGTHEGVIGADDAGAPGSGTGLPATGSGLGLAAVGLLGLAALGRRFTRR